MSQNSTDKTGKEKTFVEDVVNLEVVGDKWGINGQFCLTTLDKATAYQFKEDFITFIRNRDLEGNVKISSVTSTLNYYPKPPSVSKKKD